MFTVTMDFDSYCFGWDEPEAFTFNSEKEAKDFIYDKIKSERKFFGEYGESDFDLEECYFEPWHAYTFTNDFEETYIFRLIES